MMKSHVESRIIHVVVHSLAFDMWASSILLRSPPRLYSRDVTSSIIAIALFSETKRRADQEADVSQRSDISPTIASKIQSSYCDDNNEKDKWKELSLMHWTDVAVSFEIFWFDQPVKRVEIFAFVPLCYDSVAYLCSIDLGIVKQ